LASNEAEVDVSIPFFYQKLELAGVALSGGEARLAHAAVALVSAAYAYDGAAALFAVVAVCSDTTLPALSDRVVGCSAGDYATGQRHQQSKQHNNA